MPAIKPRLRMALGRFGTSVAPPPGAANDRLSPLGFEDNPGNLIGRCYVPADFKGPMPLVVVLHGCTQNAAVYDHGSGWSRLADRHGFALLFPEQQRANNPMLCFNWFEPDDTWRGKGEAASIRSMVEAMQTLHGVDPARIFVTGLSAGGAMASVMLATYPEIFAAGAIIAGVAYGSASDVAGAFECMGGRGRAVADPGLKVRRASSHKGRWPRVQVWQGSADSIVHASNADAIVRQWAALHGLERTPDREDRVAGYPRRSWLGADGATVIEHYEITGMDHGIPLAPGTGEGECGVAGAHMLDVGLSSTDSIAAFFGIAPAAAERVRAAPAIRTLVQERPAQAAPAKGVQAVIENALRTAGLMR